MNEIWKPVLGFEGLYEISNTGSVKSLERIRSNGTRFKEFIKKQSTEKMGYNTVTMTDKDGKKRTLKVHRLVAEAFIPMVDGKDIVNHKNGNKTDNVVENLEWCTQLENINHARKTGLTPKIINVGNRHAKTKLTEDIVREIRKLYPSGQSDVKQLAEKYGVSNRTILKVIKGESWKDVR
ncbi:TPA: NUMOD4 domain-containing protein [Bacillus cereus]